MDLGQTDQSKFMSYLRESKKSLEVVFTSPGLYDNPSVYSTPLSNSVRPRFESDQLLARLGMSLTSSTSNPYNHSSLSDEGYASLHSIITPSELMQRIPSHLRHSHTTCNNYSSISRKPLTELTSDSYNDDLRPVDFIFSNPVARLDNHLFSKDSQDPMHQSTLIRPTPRPIPPGIEIQLQHASQAQEISKIWETIICQAFVSKLSAVCDIYQNSMLPSQDHKATTYMDSSKPNPVNLGLFSIDNLTQSKNSEHKHILAEVRQKMISVIDNIIQQLDYYFRQNPLPELVSNKYQTDNNMTPLNLKSPPPFSSKIYSTKDSKSSESLTDEIMTDGSSATTKPNSNMELVSHLKIFHSNAPSKFSPKKPSYNMGLARRVRRFGSSPRSKSRRLRIRQITKGYLQEQAKMSVQNVAGHSNLNQSLDLKVRKTSPHLDQLDSESTDPGSGTQCKRVSEDSTVKFTTLSAHHLKKAKLMFMYSRYPHSTLLKSYFPEMVFNRSTTAQLVKWFSNFREFFYLQIEKFVRQAKAAGLTRSDQIDLIRNPELIQSMELHFNKGGEISTPKEFINVIHTAVQEFANAILNGQDINPTWRKAIYKKICLLDVIFPSFFKQI